MVFVGVAFGSTGRQCGGPGVRHRGICADVFRGAAWRSQESADIADRARANVDARTSVARIIELPADPVSRWIRLAWATDRDPDVAACYGHSERNRDRK